MEFKLKLVPDRPTDGDVVLAAETPLSGVEFIAEVGKDLRRSIDHVARGHHTTLGTLAQYEVTVPQAIAIASGKFETANTYTVVVENDLLSHFIFHKADVMYKSAGRRCYPYMLNEATLVSLIDELAFLDAWIRTGYASRLAWSGNQMVGMEYAVPGEDDNNGGIGCVGCTICEDIQHCQNHTCQSFPHRPPDHMWPQQPPFPGRPPMSGFEPPPKPPIVGHPGAPRPPQNDHPFIV